MPTAVAPKLPHQRKFGVEIECGLEGGLPKAKALFTPANGFSPGWTYKADGSGVEACTPILQGAKGFGELKRAYDILNVNGAYVTEADGMHVHLDAPEFRGNGALTAFLLESWLNNRTQILQMVSKRRRNSSMCKPWTKAIIADIKAGTADVGYHSGEYRDLRYRSIIGTFEVRLHEGILDFVQARAWIMFLQRFFYKVAQDGKNLPPLKNDDALFEALRLNEATARVLKDKAAHYAQMEPDDIRQDDGHPENGGGPWS